MPNLQVLNLAGVRVEALLESSSSLRKLTVHHCELLSGLSSEIKGLEQLEVLDLHGTEIFGIPKEVACLTNLRCLSLSFCHDLNSKGVECKSGQLIPEGTINGLSRLEELSICVNPEDEKWEKSVDCIVDEISGLSMLKSVKLYLPQTELLMSFNYLWQINPIERFEFTVGRDVDNFISRLPEDVQFKLEEQERRLYYINGEKVDYNVKDALCHTTAFLFDRHKTATSLSEFGIGNMNKLKYCVIADCDDVRYLLDGYYFFEEKEEEDEDDNDDSSYGSVLEYNIFASDSYSLGSLEYLYLYSMKSLRGLSTGPYRECLCKLKYLEIQTCPQLTVIFTPDFMGNLSKLEELKIKDCGAVTSLVTCDYITGYQDTCFLPKLKKMSLSGLPKLVSISSGLRLAPDLELLSLENCPMLSLPEEEVGDLLTMIRTGKHIGVSI